MWDIKFIASTQKEAHATVDEKVKEIKVIPSGVVSIVHDAIDAAAMSQAQTDSGEPYGVFVECHGHAEDSVKFTDGTMRLCVMFAPMPKE